MNYIITIITINYNNAEGLKKTFESVRNQTYKNYEYVVIDGGSADESKIIIEQNKNIINYYCSEKDEGIYDGQNKGIQQAKGNYLIFLNSGDAFDDNDFLNKATNFIEDNPSFSLIYCDTILKNSDGSFYDIIQPDKLDLFYFYMKTLNHQSCLIKRNLFDTFGLYESQYKICADFDFILKVFINDSKQFLHFNTFAVIYENDGFSAHTANYDIVVNERKKIIATHFTKQQISNCVKKERELNTWQMNTKKQLYSNKASYRLIKFYVKIKGLFWKK
jgi:glycosyltransferase involved in cell wall biosynthesis